MNTPIQWFPKQIGLEFLGDRKFLEVKLSGLLRSFMKKHVIPQILGPLGPQFASLFYSLEFLNRQAAIMFNDDMQVYAYDKLHLT